MGCSFSREIPDTEIGKKRESNESKALTQSLEKDQREENSVVKLLVLGTGESGKSTIFKQMKILYSVPDPLACGIASKGKSLLRWHGGSSKGSSETQASVLAI